MSKIILEDYIGDGVYAEWDGYGIKLRTDRDHSEAKVNEYAQITHWIYLEPEVIVALNHFAERINEMRRVQLIQKHPYAYDGTNSECTECNQMQGSSIHFDENEDPIESKG